MNVDQRRRLRSNRAQDEFSVRSPGFSRLGAPSGNLFVLRSHFFLIADGLILVLLCTSAPLFTLRSLDQRPLSRSRKVRVFHAFGNERIPLGGVTVSVTREAVLDPTHPPKG